jgi:predicted RecA/RadA family phage recombinase
MTGTYIQRGDVIDYTNSGSAAIAVGEVVTLATRIGVASAPIAVGTTGALHVAGVFELTKKASEAITLGAAVYYTADGITATAGDNVPAGWAVEAAAASGSTVKVKIG